MTANRNLNKSLAYRAFRDARAAYARNLAEFGLSEATRAVDQSLDDFKVPENSPLRAELFLAVVKLRRPGADKVLAQISADENAKACGDLFRTDSTWEE